MTPAEAETLGRRWIAAGGGWREGMLTMPTKMVGRGERVTSAGNNHVGFGTYFQHHEGLTPDLRDAATRGAALEVVRERWHLPALYVRWDAYLGRAHDPEQPFEPGDDNDPAVVAADNTRAWRVLAAGVTEEHFKRLADMPENLVLGHGASEAEALVSALIPALW